jgi:hypothetical protein
MGDSYVIDKDKGFARIMKTELEAEGSVSVGWFSGAGETDEGTPIASIAVFNEFGTRRIPERPMVRRTLEEHGQRYQAQVAHMKRAIHAGVLTWEALLYRLGLMVRNDLVMMITSAKEWAKPNAPETIKQKGSSSPLIDTGAMRNSVWFEITTKSGKRKMYRS